MCMASLASLKSHIALLNRAELDLDKFGTQSNLEMGLREKCVWSERGYASIYVGTWK